MLAPPIEIVYARNLLCCRRGLALFDPTPSRDSGPVQIGDVGSIFRGRFLRAFNVFRPAGDPLNRFGVPENFIPVDFQLQQLEAVDGYPIPAGVLCSKGVVRVLKENEMLNFVR